MKREDVTKVLDGGEAILEALRNLDMDYVFSSPGSEWGAVWEAFARQKVAGTPGPKYLSCWHETLAVNLAIGYTFITGRTQAVLLHTHVGLMQGSMGVHAARLAGTPMIVMSGESTTFGDQEGFDPGGQWYTGHNYVGGMQRMLEPLVKWSGQVTSPATLYELVTRAGELAQSNPAGPVYLDVPIEMMMAPWAPPARERKVPRATRTQPPAADIDRVAKLVGAAKNPAIIVGGSGRDAEGYEALVALAKALSIPVFEASNAEFSNFPKRHPLHQGFETGPMLDEADVLLLVSAKTPWYPPRKVPAKAKVVVIDECAFRPHMAYQTLHAHELLEGHVPSTLKLLAAAVAGADTKERLARWSAAHDRLVATLRDREAKAAQSGGLSAMTVCATLAEILPKDAIYVDETTTHRALNQRHIAYEGPQSYYRVPGGLGQGVGIALGIRLAAPDRMVVPVLGDGALMYNPLTQCLGCSKNEKLPLLIVVLNNGGYRGMKNNQVAYYPDGAGAQHNIFLGETLDGPEYEDLAKPFGALGIRIDSAANLKDGLAEARRAVEGGRTALVNIRVDQ
jgi:acetolactate synthase I/II/III large subunit